MEMVLCGAVLRVLYLGDEKERSREDPQASLFVGGTCLHAGSWTSSPPAWGAGLPFLLLRSSNWECVPCLFLVTPLCLELGSWSGQILPGHRGGLFPLELLNVSYEIKAPLEPLGDLYKGTPGLGVTGNPGLLPGNSSEVLPKDWPRVLSSSSSSRAEAI